MHKGFPVKEHLNCRAPQLLLTSGENIVLQDAISVPHIILFGVLCANLKAPHFMFQFLMHKSRSVTAWPHCQANNMLHLAALSNAPSDGGKKLTSSQQSQLRGSWSLEAGVVFRGFGWNIFWTGLVSGPLTDSYYEPCWRIVFTN